MVFPTRLTLPTMAPRVLSKFAVTEDTGAVFTWGMATTRTALTDSLAAGALTFTLGFGATTTFALTGEWNGPGLTHWDYMSGTVGDALLLPAIVGSLVWLNRQSHVELRRPFLVGSLVAGVSAVVVQYAWWRGGGPGSWMMPHPRSFSPPGWYHAVFFVITPTLVGGLALRAAAIVRRGASADAVDLFRPLAVLVGCATCFLGLVVADSLPTASTGSSIVTIGACVASCIAMVVAFAPAQSGLRPPLLMAAGAGGASAALIAALWK